MNEASNVTVIQAAVSDNLDRIEFNVRAGATDEVDDGTGAWGKNLRPQRHR